MSVELALVVFLYVVFIASQFVDFVYTRHCTRWMESTDRQIGYLTELYKMHDKEIQDLESRIKNLKDVVESKK